MKFLNVDEVNFIPNWFQKATYVEVYSPIVYPVNGQHVWETTEMPDVLLPPTKKMPERPKKKRRLEPWELMKNNTQLGQSALLKKFDIWHKLGHNRKPCSKVPTQHGPSQAGRSQSYQSDPSLSQSGPTQPPPPSPPTQPHS